MNAAIKNYELEKASCTGCGAELIFDKGDAVANCAFCGRALVREAYVKPDNIPELIIPFSITNEEAQEILTDWCKKNASKKEAKGLLTRVKNLKGCYLPYELVRGPVDCKVTRIDGGNTYECGGFIDEVFVNASRKLDNQLLDGMEPYDLEELTEFDFAYVAGHQVKAADITSDQLTMRIDNEVEESYTPVIQKTLEAKAVEVNADASNIVRMPVLLPAYYISFKGNMAAVNGQTGKVSVRAIKDSYYYILPWWVKAILATIVGTGAVALGMLLFGASMGLVEVTAGCLGLILFIVFMAAYSDTMQKELKVEKSRKIFTSKGGPYVRKDGKLEKTAKELTRPETKPVFFMDINGKREAVEIRFTTFYRMLRAFGLAFIVLFLPVIIALLLNGFNFSQLELGGSAAWFCLVVPLVPVFLVKFGRIDIYDNPWIYMVNDKGAKKRYKPKKEKTFTRKELAVTILKLLFVPPASFGVWFGIIIFCAMCYLTAFGFTE
jgi:predicted RNA-binding Zn-ribbon protein involved in translation (DUF1610 family)